MDFVTILESLGLGQHVHVLKENEIDDESFVQLTREDLGELEIDGDNADTLLWGIAHAPGLHDWLVGLGMESHLGAFLQNRVELGSVPDLEKDDLKEMGITLLGHRKKILGNLPGSQAQAPSAPPAESAVQQQEGGASADKQTEPNDDADGEALTLRDPLGEGVQSTYDDMRDSSKFLPFTHIGLGNIPFAASVGENKLGIFTSKDGTGVRTYFDLEMHVTDWYHIRYGKLTIKTDESLIELPVAAGDSSVISGDLLYEKAIYRVTTAQLKEVLDTSGLIKVRISGSGGYHDIQFDSAAVDDWRWFYQSLFDESAYPEAAARREEQKERDAEAVRNAQKSSLESARKWQDMAGGKNSFLGGLVGAMSGVDQLEHSVGAELDAEKAEEKGDPALEDNTQASEQDAKGVEDKKEEEAADPSTVSKSDPISDALGAEAGQAVEQVQKAMEDVLGGLGNVFGGWGKKK